MPRLAVLCLILVLTSSPGLAADSTIDPSRLAGLAVRSIGPAGMSGRVAAVVGVESDPDILYLGGAGGGIWKTVNAGTTWEPVFDSQSALPIGAIAVFQANPAIVWAGTGEANLHESALSGDGVYRSLDGGRTWSHVGLEGTGHIARIVLHP